MANSFSRHVPKSDTICLNVLSFKEALFTSQTKSLEYDVEKWVYVPSSYEEYRYILGTRGKNPLIVIGANPSTASPDKLDPTLKSVDRISINNGYDSFLMLNVYPQRSTDPNFIESNKNDFLIKQNLEAFEYVLEISLKKEVWCAWGNVICQRHFMKNCVSRLISVGRKFGAKWLCAGPLLKSGNPHHPLYLKSDVKLTSFKLWI